MIGWGILQQGSAPLPSQPFPSFVGAGPRPAHGRPHGAAPTALRKPFLKSGGRVRTPAPTRIQGWSHSPRRGRTLAGPREGQIPIPFVSLRSTSPLDKGSRPLPYGSQEILPSSGRGGPWASRRGVCKPRRHPHPPPLGAPVPIPSVAARHLPLIRGVGPLGGGRLAGG